VGEAAIAPSPLEQLSCCFRVDSGLEKMRDQTRDTGSQYYQMIYPILKEVSI
jgi:hypothetical protein